MGKGESSRTRTSRVHLAIPVFVYGHLESGAPFKEITQTVTINADGCLIELATPVAQNQTLLLTNIKTNEEMSCTVVSFGNPAKGKTQVGLRFAHSSPRFWELRFPPEDWDPATRKLPGPVKR
jgi:hypothetical protein